MKAEIKQFVEEKTKEILQADSCCPELKSMAEAWLKAENTPEEKAVTEAYLKELSEDVLPIDALIDFSSSKEGEKIFGAAQAQQMAEAGCKAKKAGGKYCICPACTPGGAILDKREEILAEI